jgi:hypothetical protein
VIIGTEITSFARPHNSPNPGTRHSSRVNNASSFAMLAAIRRASFRLQSFVRPAVDIGQRLPVGIADDIATGHLLGAPGRGEIFAFGSTLGITHPKGRKFPP